jgi:hypothetical protein
MRRSLKHYLNDQCARLLRNFPYPVKQKVRNFPVVPGKGDASVVAVLCRSGQFLEGLWSLWSWMSQLNFIMGAVLLFDGKVSVEQQALFQKLFPNGRLLELAKFLKSRSLPPYLKRFVAANWTGKKFAAVYELQKERGVLYSDSDVLAFARSDQIIESAQNGSSTFLFDRFGYDLDPWIATQAEKIGIPVTKHFNAGLVYVPQGEMQDSLLETILSNWQPSYNTHHAEQTLFSVMLNPSHLHPMPEKDHVLSWRGAWIFEKDLDCNSLICRHYVGPVRHRMYLTGYPFLLNQIQLKSDK